VGEPTRERLPTTGKDCWSAPIPRTSPSYKGITWVICDMHARPCIDGPPDPHIKSTAEAHFTRELLTDKACAFPLSTLRTSSTTTAGSVRRSDSAIELGPVAPWGLNPAADRPRLGEETGWSRPRKRGKCSADEELVRPVPWPGIPGPEARGRACGAMTYVRSPPCQGSHPPARPPPADPPAVRTFGGRNLSRESLGPRPPMLEHARARPPRTGGQALLTTLLGLDPPSRATKARAGTKDNPKTSFENHPASAFAWGCRDEYLC